MKGLYSIILSLSWSPSIAVVISSTALCNTSFILLYLHLHIHQSHAKSKSLYSYIHFFHIPFLEVLPPIELQYQV